MNKLLSLAVDSFAFRFLLSFMFSFVLSACSRDGSDFNGSDCKEDLSPGCYIRCFNGSAFPTTSCNVNLEGDRQVIRLSQSDSEICQEGSAGLNRNEYSAHELKGYIPICKEPPQSESELEFKAKQMEGLDSGLLD